MNTQVDAVVRCLPVGICSWDFIFVSDRYSGKVTFHWASERGSIMIDQHAYEVDKSGFFSPTWMLMENGHTLITAQRLSALGRTFTFTSKETTSVLRAVSMFSTTMILEGDHVDCLIARDHPFTRRTTLSGKWEDFRLVAFAFWITVLMRRRAAASSGAS